MSKYYVLLTHTSGTVNDPFIIGRAPVYNSLENARRAFTQIQHGVREPLIAEVEFSDNFLGHSQAGMVILPPEICARAMPAENVYLYSAIEPVNVSVDPVEFNPPAELNVIDLSSPLAQLKREFEKYKEQHRLAGQEPLIQFAIHALQEISRCESNSTIQAIAILKSLFRVAQTVGAQRPLNWISSAIEKLERPDRERRVLFANHRPEASPQLKNPIERLKNSLALSLRAYQELLKKESVPVRGADGHVREILLQKLDLKYWPDKYKDRFTTAEIVIQHLQRTDLTERQMFIVLKQGLTAARRIQSNSLKKLFETALQYERFAEMQQQSTLRSISLPNQQTIRGEIAGRDNKDIPKYFRCSLTGEEITSTPITLMNGKTFDFEKLFKYIQENGVDEKLKSHFQEELEINANLARSLLGLQSLSRDELLKTFVINRPLQNLMAKFRSNTAFEEDDFCCEIGLSVMQVPVLSISGHSCERENLERALQGKQEDPFSRDLMTVLQIRPNQALAEAIVENQHLFEAQAASSFSKKT